MSALRSGCTVVIASSNDLPKYVKVGLGVVIIVSGDYKGKAVGCQ